MKIHTNDMPFFGVFFFLSFGEKRDLRDFFITTIFWSSCSRTITTIIPSL